MQVGCAFKHNTFEFPASSLKVIELALTYIINRGLRKSIIISDSLSALHALEWFNSSHPLVQRIQSLYGELSVALFESLFLWVPGHRGIVGNEATDILAKRGANKPSINFSQTFLEYSQRFFKIKIKKLWSKEKQRGCPLLGANRYTHIYISYSATLGKIKTFKF